MDSSLSFFDIFLAGMGVYALIGGIRGKGKLFSAKNVKEGCEEKLIRAQRILYIVLGACMTINAGFSLLLSALYERTAVDNVWQYVPKTDLGQWSFLTGKLLSALSFAFMVLSMAAIVVLIVAIRKFTDKSAEKKDTEQRPQNGARGCSMPSAAFDFPDEPKEETKKKK